MNNLMTLVMNIVRKMTGSDQKMNISDATNALNLALTSVLPVYNIWFKGEDDLNDFTTPGQYLIRNTAGTTKLAEQHDPCTSNGWGSLFVFRNDFYVNQIMTDNNLNPAIVYHRSKNIVDNNPWTAWAKLGGVVKALLSALHPVRGCLA